MSPTRKAAGAKKAAAAKKATRGKAAPADSSPSGRGRAGRRGASPAGGAGGVKRTGASKKSATTAQAAPARKAARSDSADPLGKRALFAPPDAPRTRRDPFAPPPPQGRQALYGSDTTADSRIGLAVIDCPACGRRTPVGPGELLAALVPSLWVPWRRPSRWLRCPACGRRTWAEVAWNLTGAG